MNELLSESQSRVVRNILVRELQVGPEQLVPEARFIEDLAADSLTMLEVSMAIDEHLHLTIPDECWDRVQTVGHLFEILAELLQGQRR